MLKQTYRAQGYEKGRPKDKFANRFANSRCKPPGAGTYKPPVSNDDGGDDDLKNPFKNTGW